MTDRLSDPIKTGLPVRLTVLGHVASGADKACSTGVSFRVFAVLAVDEVGSCGKTSILLRLLPSLQMWLCTFCSLASGRGGRVETK